MKNISIPLGESKITRTVESLDIVIKTCTSINLVTQNKKRIFEKDKSEYTFRSINSIINSLKFNESDFKKIKVKIYIIDHNSKKEDLEKIENNLKKSKLNMKFKILTLKNSAKLKL